MQLALEKKERLSPSPCMHTASIWGEGTFCLDREFSKNAPYKQKIILPPFHKNRAEFEEMTAIFHFSLKYTRVAHCAMCM